MSIHINEVLEYLDNNLVSQRAENIPSLMAALREAYVLHDTGETESDPELLAFSQGVVTGMLLMTEVKRIP